MQITFETNEHDEQIKVTTLDSGVVIRELDRPAATPPVMLSKLAFRGRFTIAEQAIIDNFSIPEFVTATAKISSLTVQQRANVRTAIATYRDASEIGLADALTVEFVGLLGTYGLLDDNTRAATILTP